jgi:hypothetical protein
MDECLPFAGVNTTIRVFRQALALDEVCSDNINLLSIPFRCQYPYATSFEARNLFEFFFDLRLIIF